jgi:hypothetical protein
VKLYKQYAKNKKSGEVHAVEAGEAPELEESRVGQKLSDLTTRRVIIGVLLMLFILPLFDATTFDEDTTLMSGGFEMVVQVCQILPLPISRYRFKFQSNLVCDSIKSISNFCFQF